MDSPRNGNTNGAGYPRPDAAEQFLRKAREALAEILAREIPGDLFEPSREEMLKLQVSRILDEWLKREKVPIGRLLRLKLLDLILADLHEQ